MHKNIFKIIFGLFLTFLFTGCIGYYEPYGYYPYNTYYNVTPYYPNQYYYNSNPLVYFNTRPIYNYNCKKHHHHH